ncbi:hypothetical protein O7627_21300 [Solwaraspora sp. WMMD1047]|uniref:hypothetical protein n=1 Tax=Solwaraspora sp. WMMD1047 TaxID=3016102 RepID=UPI002417E96E|nr:hypothetical protein [Solwaraspora sp. WMMD1047]MDG4831820.1 hypothetical protein [Solwaraspora sp. WMMD1047]
MTQLSRARRAGGFFLLPFIPDRPPPPPATDASWAWSLRRIARHALWLLPGYAVWLGILSLASADGANPAAYLASDRPLHLVGWVLGVWLGLLALLALTGLLVVTRTRRTALTGFLLALGGTLLTLPFAGVSEQSPAYGADARVLAVIGAIGYSAGWMVTGWAVIRSGVLTYGDGLLLMMAGPLVGVVGLFSDQLQTLGAMLALAAGIGIAWRSGRLLPAVHRAAEPPPAETIGSPETGTPPAPQVG